jgi:muconolactone D-isomerase
MEFLVSLEFNFPAPDRDKIVSDERAMTADLRRAGTLQRVWRDPARNANWSLWNVKDTDELHALFAALPAFPYLQNVKVHPLASHPSDPGVGAS